MLCEFRELKTLQLEGNGIQELSEVDKLAGLPKLTKLSLHGNPVCQKEVTTDMEILVIYQTESYHTE